MWKYRFVCSLHSPCDSIQTNRTLETLSVCSYAKSACCSQPVHSAKLNANCTEHNEIRIAVQIPPLRLRLFSFLISSIDFLSETSHVAVTALWVSRVRHTEACSAPNRINLFYRIFFSLARAHNPIYFSHLLRRASTVYALFVEEEII